MDPGARRLADDEQAGGRRGAEDRTRPEWQVRGADLAGANFGGKAGKRMPFPLPPSCEGRGRSGPIQ